MKQNAYDQDSKSLTSNAAKLVFFGNQTTQIIVHSLLAKSISRNGLKLLMQNESETYANHHHLVKQRTVLGKVHFASL